MHFRKLDPGIYIDEGCHRIIQLPGGWFVPDTGNETVRKLMEAVEQDLRPVQGPDLDTKQNN